MQIKGYDGFERFNLGLAIGKVIFGEYYGAALDNVVALAPQGLYSSEPTYNGEQILYQDAAKTTPATADGDPVGWRKDLSGQGLHATQGTSANRPTLRKDGSGNWYLEYSGSHSLTVAGTASAWKFLHSTEGSVVAGVRYGTTSNPDALHPVIGSAAVSEEIGAFFGYDDRSGASLNNAWITTVYGGTFPVPVSDIEQDKITPNTNVVVAHQTDPDHATAADRSSGRVDGVAVGGNNTMSGTPSTSNAIRDYTIGQLNGYMLYLIGRDYGLWVDDAQLSGYRLATVEAWLADVTGVTLA